MIDEHDFMKSHKNKVEDFHGESIKKYKDSGTWAYRTSHCLHRNQDVRVYGVLCHGKCYTNGLICPSLPVDHPEASEHMSVDYVKANDLEFAAGCERAMIQVVFLLKSAELADL